MGKHRRFFIDPRQISGSLATITGDTLRQITHVLRLTDGQEIVLLDGSGREYFARIVSLSRKEVVAEVESSRECPAEPAFDLTLSICLPKGDKLDLIVQKATELGISRLIVVDSQRVVAKISPEKSAGRIERWKKIASEAAEQSGRARVPDIEGVLAFDELLAQIKRYDLALIAWEDEERVSFKDVLRDGFTGSAMIMIGPEGGLTDEEAYDALAAGAISASLGKRVLRAETAAIAACAIIMHELDSAT